MIICKNCGHEIADDAAFCPVCGARVSIQDPQDQYGNYSQPQQQQYYNYQPPQQQAPQQETGTGGYGVLGFFFPLIGLILYLVWKDDHPMRSKAAGKGALIGVIVEVVLGVVVGIIYGVMIGSMIGGAMDAYGAMLLL